MGRRAAVVKDCLSNRKQRVIMYGAVSDRNEVNEGVP